MTRQQIADEFDRLQADVGFFAHGQTVSVDITTRRDRLPAVIALVGKLLREPNFAAPALEEAARPVADGGSSGRRRSPTR